MRSILLSIMMTAYSSTWASNYAESSIGLNKQTLATVCALGLSIPGALASIDYNAIMTDEWTYWNTNVQTIFGCIGWLSMFVSFGTAYHFYHLTQQDINDVLELRRSELERQASLSGQSVLIIKMKAFLEGRVATHASFGRPDEDDDEEIR